MEALKAATSVPAAVLGLEAEWQPEKSWKLKLLPSMRKACQGAVAWHQTSPQTSWLSHLARETATRCVKHMPDLQSSWASRVHKKAGAI